MSPLTFLFLLVVQIQRSRRKKLNTFGKIEVAELEKVTTVWSHSIPVKLEELKKRLTFP